MATGSSVEVAPKVYSVPVGEGGNNVYLIVGERAAFIDSGHDEDDEVSALVSCWQSVGSPEIAGIVLTHRHLDHTGGARRLAEATGGAIISSPAEKPYIEELAAGTRVARTVDDGETLDLGGATLEFVHTPGHTLGSVCVHHREEGILFTGDHILGSSSTSINPEQGDMVLYLDSLRKLLAYDARMICPGHGPLINKPRANIEGLIERRMQREGEILELLQNGQRTVEQIFGTIYSKLNPSLHRTARNQIRSHLVKLERDGAVRPVQGEEDTYLLT